MRRIEHLRRCHLVLEDLNEIRLCIQVKVSFSFVDQQNRWLAIR